MHNRAKTYTVYGVTKTIPEWAKQTGLTPQAIRYRLNSGWTIEEALTSKRRRLDLSRFHVTRTADDVQRVFERQLRATLRQYVRTMEQQIRDLNQRALAAFTNQFVDLADASAAYVNRTHARYVTDAANAAPGGARNFAKKPSDRSSPVAQDRG